MHPPWRLLGASLLVAAGLQNLVPMDPVHIDVADASDHDGSRVRMAGAVRSVQQYGPDVSRFVLVQEGYGVAARLEGPLPVGQGEWVEASGRLDRSQGRLTFFIDALAAASPPPPQAPAWSQVAQDPQAWSDRWIRLEGTVIEGRMHGDGASVHMGEGPWPETGHVAATGVLAYEPKCLCHAFHAHAVHPWTD